MVIMEIISLLLPNKEFMGETPPFMMVITFEHINMTLCRHIKKSICSKYWKSEKLV